MSGDVAVSSILPPPLRGRVGVGGNHTLRARGTPIPDPSPQGGGGSILRGLARILGITMIFSILGPMAFALTVLAIIAGFGAPLTQLVAAFAGHDLFSTIVSVALWVLGMVSLLAAIPPSMAAGVIFGFAAVCAGLNTVWMAWLAAAAAIAGVILLGNFTVTDDSSAVILPGARSTAESLSLFGVLGVLSILPVTLCWWLARPLHRASIAA